MERGPLGSILERLEKEGQISGTSKDEKKKTHGEGEEKMSLAQKTR